MNQGEIVTVNGSGKIASINLVFDQFELDLLWTSLLCAGHGQLPTPDRQGRRIELTDEAQKRARDLADEVHLALRTLIV